METGYVVALATGVIGGFGHCIGMCGPIVISYTYFDESPAPLAYRITTHIFYNTGRITTYAFIGAFMGLAGSFVNVAGRISGIQNVVALIAGCMMILMGLKITGIAGNIRWLERHGNIVLSAGKELLREKSVWRYYPLGALFGFLPCGLSYTAFMASAGTGDPLSGMLLMLFFGIGTFPALFLFGSAASYLSMRMRGFLYRVAGLIIVVMGIMFLFRGAGWAW